MWFRNWLSRRKRRPVVNKARSATLLVELLEDRTAPAVLFSDSLQRNDVVDRIYELGAMDNTMGYATSPPHDHDHFYVPIFNVNNNPSMPVGADIKLGNLQNRFMDFGGVQFTNGFPGGSGESIAQDLNIHITVEVPRTLTGELTQAGPYFRSRLAAAGDGIIGGDSAGYWVMVDSYGEVTVKPLGASPGFFARTGRPDSFGAFFHTMEIAVQGSTLQVVLDGKLQTFLTSSGLTTSVNIPETSGSNQGGAGIAFGAEPNRGQAGGQRVGEIVVETYSSLSHFPVQNNFENDYDYGDAPDTGVNIGGGNYRTLASDNGASHLVVSGLKIGATVDGELNATANSAAGGDDATGVDDEDGVTTSLSFVPGQTPSIQVDVTNTTGTTATLYGWIDYNGNGSFDNATERASVTVPTGTIGPVTLTFPTIPSGSGGSTYARFRLSTDTAAANSVGSAANGEVEDYGVSIQSIINVTTTLDENNGVGAGAGTSLREAILAANASSGADTINLPAGTYTLTITGRNEEAGATGDLDLIGNFTINGAGQGLTIIQAGASAGAGIDRIIDARPGATVTINHLTIQHGNVISPSGGGAILAQDAALTLQNVTVRNSLGDQGAGIMSFGNASGDLTINDSIIEGNTSKLRGAGINISGPRTLFLNRSTIQNNTNDTEHGGGIAVHNTGTNAIIVDSTINNNSAGRIGGGVFTFNPITITNSTIANNSAKEDAGGVFGGATILNSTITANRANSDGVGTQVGGGLWGVTSIKNTIVAGNFAGTGTTASDIGNALTNVAASTHNLVGDAASAGGLSNNVNGNLVGVASPGLGTLGNFGGPSQTVPLLAGSPAINTGLGSGAPTNDQRGTARVDTADIGAFEYVPPVVATVSGVTSSNDNGAYQAGTVIAIQVSFTENVTVTGTPQLTLNTGAVVDYASGSGSTTLTFNYTVGSGQNSSDLDYASTAALALNGGSILGSDNAANLALPSPGAVGSLGASKALIIDTTPPTVSAAISAGTLGNAGWYTSNVTVQFTSSDNLSGVVSNPANQILSTEGASVSSTSQTVTDGAGNVSAASNVVAVSIDKTAPTTAATPSGTAGTNGWYRSAVTVSFNASDAASGVAFTEYSTNGGTSWVSGTSVLVSSDGNHAVMYRSVDVAGNVEATQTLNLKIDATPPTVSAAIHAGASGNAGWYTSNVTVRFTSSDNLSGVASNPADQILSAEGAAVASTAVIVTDEAGNVSAASNVVTLSIDKSAPTTTATPSGTSGTNGWYRSAVTVDFAASDSGSGVARTEYSTNGGATWTTSTSAVVSGDGTHTASYRSVDVAGNTETAQTLNLSIDTTTPVPTLTPARTPDVNGWYNQPIGFTVGASDATSGVASMSSNFTYSGPDSATASVQASATDLAGNVGNATFNFKYDATQPSLTVPANAVVDATSGAGATASTAFTATAADGLTASPTIRYFVGGAQGTEITSTFVFPVGSTVVTVVATDDAGNAQSGTFTVTIRETPHGTIGSDTPTFIWAPVAGAVRYDLYVVNQTTGQSPALHNPNVLTNSWTPTAAQALTPGQSYIWYVGAVNAAGVTTWSAGTTFSIAALANPTQLGPAGTISASTGYDRPTFTWSAVAGAHHYYLYVVSNSTGQVVINNPNVLGTSFTALTPLTPGHTFTWYVGAVSNNGAVLSFAPAGQTFSLAGLASPTQAGPVGTISAAPGYDRPTFTWSSVGGADQYYIVVNNTTVGGTVVSMPAGNGTSFTLPAGQTLTPGHAYTWYVAAVSANGQAFNYNVQGQSFSLAPLAAPVQTAPSGVVSASTGYDLPTFTWSSVPGAHHYYLLVIDNDFGVPVLLHPNVVGTSYTTTQPLTPGHRFTWYVGAISNSGLVNSYAPTGQSFSLASLDAPTQTGPTGTIAASTDYDKPTFTWNPVAGAHHYYLYVIDSATGQPVINNPNVSGTSFTSLQALTPGRSYSWYVGAISTNGVINRFNPAGQTFTLAMLANPTLSGPAGTIAAAAGFDLPTFTWSAVPGAHHYYLYVIDSATGQPVINHPNVSSTSFTATQALTPGRSYHWYVGAISTNGAVNRFDPAGQAFTLAGLAPPAQNGPSGVIGSTTPTFTWSASPGADHYYLYVVDNTTGQVAINLPNAGNGTSIVSPVALARGRRYTWYLGAISTNGLINSYAISGLTFEIV